MIAIVELVAATNSNSTCHPVRPRVAEMVGAGLASSVAVGWRANWIGRMVHPMFDRGNSVARRMEARRSAEATDSHHHRDSEHYSLVAVGMADEADGRYESRSVASIELIVASAVDSYYHNSSYYRALQDSHSCSSNSIVPYCHQVTELELGLGLVRQQRLRMAASDYQWNSCRSESLEPFEIEMRDDVEDKRR